MSYDLNSLLPLGKHIFSFLSLYIILVCLQIYDTFDFFIYYKGNDVTFLLGASGSGK